MQTLPNNGKPKDIFKQAIIEAMEDIAMINTIQKSENSGSTSRAAVFNILKGKE